MAQVCGPMGLLYVFKREFAVTYPHDNKVSLIGTDELTTDLVVVVRHTGELLRARLLIRDGCQTSLPVRKRMRSVNRSY